MASAARFFLKVYDKTGATYRQTIPASRLLSVPVIIREASKMAGDITISLAYPWDNFGFNASDGIKLYDRVKIYAQNDENPSGVLVFQGFVTELHGLFDPTTNHIEVRLLPIESVLAQALYLKSGSYSIPISSGNLGDDMWQAVSDGMTAQSLAGLFTQNTMNPPGITAVFNLQYGTHMAMVTKLASYLQDGWYWRVRPDGTFDLQAYNTAADHVFTIAKDVQALDVVNSILDLKNGTLMSWGSPNTDTYRSDAPSQGAYGMRDERIQDSTIGSLASAQSAGDGNVARKKNPVAKTIVTVNRRYPIETILPGDTCKILNNTNGSSQMLPPGAVYRIVRVEYDGATAKITLGDLVENVGLELSRVLGQYTQR